MAPPRAVPATMIEHPTIQRSLRALAFLAGLATMAGAVLGWRLPPRSQSIGVELTMTASAPRPLEVAPTGPVLRGRAMKPSSRGTARGVLSLTNRGPRALRMRIRARANQRALDDQLLYAVSTGGLSLFRGTQRQLGDWSSRSLILPAGARRRLTVSSWLARAPARAAADSIVDVSLEVRGRPDADTDCVDQPPPPPGQPQPWIPRPPLPPCLSPR